MPNIIHSNTTASITELKTNPMATVSAGDGYPVAILNRNQPAFYCVPAELYEQMLEYIDDQELANLVKERSEQTLHDVNLDRYL
ncbi:type II toxin-antitoxin system Phd/YefM family antitoxin [Yersinia mollaretii]|jgi:antitoxin StbD|uniref:type II toxin-antitoxin system Phd/YefM family antitoxin n=1 Tax=Yersinia mollaretii TaxID=33060 RepID=UPI0025AA9E7C|nr:type II toxin-antitoxin system Phd/YefM family antitoxin [Yersinia mollaretii]MDN0112702.1 type II toxin-antitoxin system Phd/YefM family antitoxin [Yersinia mollaretii]